MTTNFALSLSFDGIQLLQRVQDGWHLVGKTDLDTSDLGAELSKLRETALSLDPSGLRTKLLISEDQIKFITLETAQTELSDVMEALDGATPYAVDELVIDFDRNGGRTYIAAVARETLAEAEAFAQKHEFAPVAFAAIAAPLTFKSEVFFGPTSVASKVTDDVITRDDAPFEVTGVVDLPEPEPEESDEPPVFTPRARMATPESVVPEASKPSQTEPTVSPEEVTPGVEAPKVETFDPASAAPLAVQTGPATGPAVKVQSAEAPPAPSKPVTNAMREPTIAPVVKRILSNPAPATPESTIKTVPASQADDIAARGGFSSRRAAPVTDARPQEEKPAAAKKAAAISTKQAKTKRGKPRFLGLILTAILLIAMALVALWASTLSEEDLAGWFGFNTIGIVETAAAPEPEPPATEMVAVAPEAQDAAVTAAEATTQDAEPATLPPVRLTEEGRVLSPAEANRIYAATGVWQRAPRLPLKPRSDTITISAPQSEAISTALAQPILPEASSMAPDLALLPPSDPPAPGTVYERDANGFVLATPEGTVTPQGALVIAGAPTKRPPSRPIIAPTEAQLTPEAAIDTPEGVVIVAGRPSKVPPLRPEDAALPEVVPEDVVAAVDPALAGFRPNLRPDNLAPTQEVATFAADPALAGARPKLRPVGLAPSEVVVVEEPAETTPTSPDIASVVAAIARATPVSSFVTPTARAVKASRRPDTRPRNFSRVVSRATDLANQQAARAATATAPAASTSVSNQAARPSGSTPGGVAQAATMEGAIKLRDINLIGVYGRPNDRRALVRLGNGRYVKVEIGSSIDGGRVTAIGDSALNYVKRGKTYALQLPSG